jgi:MerR family transcriptional regulator, light-induced transcriptional regulator
MTADPRPAQGLTIGDLAHRSGLAPATLRAWEARHGFPRPHRLPSGHRRYDEQDLALVRQVLRRKAAGVRLESAIAEAAAARRTPVASVFAELHRAYPQVPVQPLRKSTLLALTWAMEDECCARAQQPTLFAAFQHERFFRQAENRWTDLARTSRSTVVFADFATEGMHRSTSGAACVHLPVQAPMRREWSLVCDAPDHPAALAAWELPGQSDLRDADRLFECVWTLDPTAVRDAARACAGLVADLAPEFAEDLDPLDTIPNEPSEDLRAATTMFTRLLGYVDRYR